MAKKSYRRFDFSEKEREIRPGVIVKVSWKDDDSPDLSYLEHTPEEIEREARSMANNPDYKTRRGKPYSYKGALMVLRRNARDDADRLSNYDDSWWSMVGCCAELSINGERISAASLWGIESDSDPDYLESVEQEMIEEVTDGMEKAIQQRTAELRRQAEALIDRADSLYTYAGQLDKMAAIQNA